MCLFAHKSILGTVAVFAIIEMGAVMTPSRPSHTASELHQLLMPTSEMKYVLKEEKSLFPLCYVTY